jgi:hypothetical protein
MPIPLHPVPRVAPNAQVGKGVHPVETINPGKTSGQPEENEQILIDTPSKL